MVKSLWQKISGSKENILKGGLILFIGVNIVNFGNYLFNLLMGRYLGPSDYGSLVSLISLIAIIGVPATTIQTSVMKFSATFKAEKTENKINFLIKYLNKKILLFSLICLIVLIASSNLLSNFLNLSSIFPLIILSFSIVFLFLLPINRGVLQGIQDFKSLSINMGLEPIIKIIIGLVLVLVGLKLSGTMLAIFMSSILVYFISFTALKNILKSKPQEFDTSTFWKYSLPTLIGIFLMNMLTYIDVVLVKHFFSPQDAGLYSGLSTISKIVLYFSMPFVAAMFPKISDLHTKNEKHFPVLAQTFMIASIFSLAIMGFFMIFPTFSIGILFGKDYISASPYLGSLAFAMFLLILINVFFNYFLAIGEKKFLIFLFIFSILEIVLITHYHANFNQIINNLIISFGGLLFSLGLYYIYLKKEQITYALSHNSSL